MDTSATCAIGAKIAGAAKIGDSTQSDQSSTQKILSGRDSQRSISFYNLFLKTQEARESFVKMMYDYDEVGPELKQELKDAAEQSIPVPLIVSLNKKRNPDQERILFNLVNFLITNYAGLKNYKERDFYYKE